jgi:hypothetical protein
VKYLALLLIPLLATAALAYDPPDSLWSYQTGGLGGQYPAGVALTPDNNIVWAGNTYQFDGMRDTNPSDILLGCLTLNGEVLWERRLELPDKEEARDVTVSPDGFIGITGSIRNIRAGIIVRALYIICNQEGDILFYGSYAPEGVSVEARGGRIFGTDADGFTIAGLWSCDTIPPSPFLMKIAVWGDVESLDRFETDDGLWMMNACPHPDGGLYIVQSVQNRLAGRLDIGLRICVTNDAGRFIFSNMISDSLADEEYPAIAAAPEGVGILNTLSDGDNQRALEDDYNLVLSDESLEEFQTVMFPRDDYQTPTDIKWVGNGFILCGADAYHFLWNGANAVSFDAFHLIRTDEAGEVLWETSYNNPQLEFPRRILPTPDGGYLLLGHAIRMEEIFQGWIGDVLIMKTGPDPLSAPTSSFFVFPSSFKLYPAFPNPFNSTTTISYDVFQPGFITLSVYDMLGKRVGELGQGYATPGRFSVRWNPTNVSSGEYLIQMEQGATTQTSRVSLQK